MRRSSWATFVFVVAALLLASAILFAAEAEGKRRVRKSKREKQKRHTNKLKVVKGPKKASETLMLDRILELADDPSNAVPNAHENNRFPDELAYTGLASSEDRSFTYVAVMKLRPFRVTRVAYSEEDKNAKFIIAEWMRELGLEVEYDAIGNLFGLWKGREVYKGEFTNIVLTGSHTDVVPEGGRYEGISGILMILESIRFMRAHGLRPRRSIEVVVFASTEPTRWGVPCIGSRAMANAFSDRELEILQTEKDMDGKLFLDVLREAGHGEVPGIEDRNATLSEIIDSVHKRATTGPGYHRYSAFLEPHIEGHSKFSQGKLLFGFAGWVAAYYNVKVTLRGKGGRASTTNAFDRDEWDVTYAAADFLNEMEKKAYYEHHQHERLAERIRINPYRLEFTPNAVGEIPHTATIWFSYHDMRDTANHNYKEQIYRDIRRNIPTGIGAEIDILSSYDGFQIDEEFRSVQQHEFAFFQQHYNIPIPSLENRWAWCYRDYGIYQVMDSNILNKIIPSGVFLTPNYLGFTKGAREYIRPKSMPDSATMLALQLRHFSFFTDIDMRNNFNVTAAILADELMERQLGGNVTKIPLSLRASTNVFEDLQILELEGDSTMLYDSNPE